MNWNKSNNDNNPWGSGGGNNPWGGGNSNNNVDFEDSIKKARERFGKFKIGGPRNLIIIILIGLLIWLASGFFEIFVICLTRDLRLSSIGDKFLPDLSCIFSNQDHFCI